MIPFLLAAAEAIPAIGKVVDAIKGHEAKAATAAAVAADPKAPADVRKAAAEVATAHVDAAADKQKAAIEEVAPAAVKAKQDNTMALVLVGAVLLLAMRR